MNKNLLSGIAATTFVASLAFAAPASAAVTFDPATGTGFVGKGDVQLLMNWSNKQLQDNAKVVDFEYTSVSSVETTWTCDKDTGPQTQERTNTTTTTVSGTATDVAREKNQVTGFILNGFDSEVEAADKEGPAVGSCPTGWSSINLVTDDPVILDEGLYLLVGGVNYGELTITPATSV